jgi:sulfoxide reductase heme-binding subunit YedZ
MVPLAITSTKAMIRRLGGKKWNRLHKLVYVIGILGVIHYGMAVKKDLEEPLMFASFFVVLYGYRIWKWRSRQHAAAA